jgi:hypothetical protein
MVQGDERGINHREQRGGLGTSSLPGLEISPGAAQTRRGHLRSYGRGHFHPVWWDSSPVNSFFNPY